MNWQIGKPEFHKRCLIEYDDDKYTVAVYKPETKSYIVQHEGWEQEDNCSGYDYDCDVTTGYTTKMGSRYPANGVVKRWCYIVA